MHTAIVVHDTPDTYMNYEFDLPPKKAVHKHVPFTPDASTTKNDQLSDARMQIRQIAFNYYKALNLHKGCLCHTAPKWAKATTCWQEFNHLTECLLVTWTASGDVAKVTKHLTALNDDVTMARLTK